MASTLKAQRGKGGGGIGPEETLVENPISRQLTSGGGKPGQGYPAVREGASVRRLTPKECERLQGLPDDWTAHGPDSRRYAALGDAVTSPVGYWIGRNIMAVAA